MNSNKQRKRMTDAETDALIQCRIRLDNLFQSKYADKSNAWRSVKDAAELHHLDIQQLKIKWNNLMKTYKEIHLKDILNQPTGKGTTENTKTPENWKYFDSLHEFASTQHNIKPVLLMSSVSNCNKSALKVPKQKSPTTISEVSYTDIEFLDEDLLEPLEETSQLPTTSSSLNTTISMTTESPSLDTTRAKRRKNQSEDLIKFLKKDSKRQKKESQHFFTIMSALWKAQNISVPDYQESSDSE